MKALMYHYVRPSPDGLPYFRYLHIDDFRLQLDWLQERFRFPSWQEIVTASWSGETLDGAVLTFDDGFRDHCEHVLPELTRRGLWGFFFVPTAPLDGGTTLDVHRVHLILGKIGGDKALAALARIVDDSMLVEGDLAAFRDRTYLQQKNDDATASFKKLLNYYISYEHRPSVISELYSAVYGASPPSPESIYMTPDEVRYMAERGMVVGSHGRSHLVFSRLAHEEQADEIRTSLGFLRRVTGGPVETFCYPYGGPNTFNDETEQILEENNVRLAFCVRPEDIEGRHLLEQPRSLPRYNCNQFPHGQAWLGRHPPPTD